MIVPGLPRFLVGPAGYRKPDFHCPGRKHLRRHDTDDGVRLVTEVDRFAEDIRIAVEDPIPKLVADHAERGSADAIFFLGKNTTELRREPNDFEEAGRDQCTGDL